MTTEAIRKTVLVDFAPGGGVRALHDPRLVVVADGDALLRARQGHRRRLRAPRRRTAVRGDRRGHGRVGQDHGLGAAASSRDGVADREVSGTEVEVRFSAGGAGIARRARASRRGNASPTRPLSIRATTAAGTSCSRPSSRRRRRRPETTAAARPTAPLRWQARSTEARRAPSRRGGALAARAPAARRRRRDRPPCRRSRSRVARARARSARAAPAEPAKSALRRSPEPGVVR